MTLNSISGIAYKAFSIYKRKISEGDFSIELVETGFATNSASSFDVVSQPFSVISCGKEVLYKL